VHGRRKRRTPQPAPPAGRGGKQLGLRLILPHYHKPTLEQHKHLHTSSAESAQQFKVTNVSER
jgi:hypothetical protein